MLKLESLKHGVGKIDFRLKRPGVHKVLVPFYHEDGDMYDIFIEELPNSPDLLRISDRGLTLMKLSYVFDIDSDTKRDVLNSIVSQNCAKLEDGEIYIDINPINFQQSLYQMLQTVAKVSNVDILSRETVQSMFYSLLNEFVVGSPLMEKVIRQYKPITGDENFVVDYRIDAQRPIFLYGVKDNSKASKVVISCLNFQKSNIPFRSLVVHENLDKLDSFNKKQITNISDKQFFTLEDFREEGLEYISRELSLSAS